VTGTPVKLSETPGGIGAAAPLLGQHTSETLSELLGLEADTLAGLAARGVVFEP
jgi:crotonobetainyl-CoA:carnitine CoA-transferase CaiB-like acyl-CoA transferase